MTLASLGLALRRYHRPLLILQWAILLFYLLLLLLPACLPLPSDAAKLSNDLTRFAQFVFWGVWWPFVILSVMLLGRAWCGLLCPEGLLSEWASRHGRGGSLPKWLRWPGWPFTAFCLTTIYGQLISVYEYPKAVLLILGGSTVAAIVVGLLYGRGKRVWCRYLCPVSGVFGLLARLAPLQFVVDRQRWAQAHPRTPAVDCPTLLNVHHLSSNQHCHMCGRCAGHRDAVQLQWRALAIEVVQADDTTSPTWENRLLVFGLLGLATSAFLWSFSPLFVQLKQTLAYWIIQLDATFLLDADAPWWLLTHYPELNDAFTWLDGICLLLFLAIGTVLIGGSTQLALRVAQKVGQQRRSLTQLTQALTPLAGINLFIGLSSLTTAQLHAEGWLDVDWRMARSVLLLLAAVASLIVVWRQWQGLTIGRRLLASASFSVALAPVVSLWLLAWWQW